MSTYPSFYSERGLGGLPPSRPRLVCVGTAAEGPSARNMPDIRRQAITAIEALLAVSDPASAREREQLRGYVEAHPGQPEVALAKHLLALKPSIDEPRAEAGPDNRP